MNAIVRGAAIAAMLLAVSSCAQPAPAPVAPDQIIALERGALDRWGKGDVHGFFEIMADDVTYFDPTLEQRLDGIAAIRKYIEPFQGKIKIDRYEMLNPKVQATGDVAILTFNVVNYRRQPDGSEAVANRWNSTEAYRRIEGAWKIAHSHWSNVRPVPARTSPE
jgi:uncharacterized protein (TIGR02246 family)